MLRYVSWAVTSKHVGLHRYFLILCTGRVPIRCQRAQSMELQEVDRGCINMLPEAFYGISRSIAFGLVAGILYWLWNRCVLTDLFFSIWSDCW